MRHIERNRKCIDYVNSYVPMLLFEGIYFYTKGSLVRISVEQSQDKFYNLICQIV